MRQRDLNLLELLWEAYRSEFGIKIRMANTEVNRARLYAARRGFPDLRIIHVEQMSIDPDHIYLTKRKMPDGHDEAHDQTAGGGLPETAAAVPEDGG